MSPGRGEVAVSDMVGTLLLVGITVTIMTGLAIFLLTLDGPGERTNADLVLSARPGADGWGSGDELVTVEHVGGEPLATDLSLVRITINGLSTDIGQGALGGAWADGELRIGELWSKQETLDEDDTVEITVILGGAENRIVASAVVLGGEAGLDCSGDVTPPVVDIWVQSPLNVTDATTGSVTVTATLVDDCAKVDQGADPSLEFRITPDASWIDTGPMTRIAPDRWSGGIPDPDWASRAGDTLQYRIVNMTDLASNVGTSITRADAIDIGNIYTYLESATPTAGTIDRRADAMADGDGAWAYVNETLGSVDLYTDNIVGSGAQDPHFAEGAADDDHAILPDRNDRIDTDGFDTGTYSGAITKVEIVVQAQRVGTPLLDDDVLEVRYRADAMSGWNIAGSWTPTIGADDEMIYDITSLHGTWAWSDIEDLDLRAEYEKIGAEDLLMEIYVDALWLRVEAGGTANTLDARFDFPSLPPTSARELQLRYQVTGDDFHVDVWDGVAWNTRGALLDSPTWTTWTYTLTVQEAAVVGGPQIRIIDETPGGGTQGQLELDYGRVRNA